MTKEAFDAQNGRSAERQAIKVLLKSTVLACTLLATGCASWVNVGESDFKCGGKESNEECKSAREVYELTHNGEVPDLSPPEEKSKRVSRFSDDTELKVEEKEETKLSETPEKDPVVDNFVAPRLPDRPVPIRTPAHVMRIWVAPWEDTNGDLITNGYVYTEIEPRRWVIGKPEGRHGDPILRPLQTIEPAAGTQQK